MRVHHISLSVLLVAVAVQTSAAQSGTLDANLADLQLRVTSLRPADSVVTRRGVLRPTAGRRLVLATLVGQTARTRTVLSTPSLLAAHVGTAIVPASAFAILSTPGAPTNWIVATPPDTLGLPQLYAVLRPGAVEMLALFDVPAAATELSVTVPQVQTGTTVIARSSDGR
jgi:hypothetical protein